MRTQSKVRVIDPYRDRVIEATPDEARILRQLKRVLDFYTTAAADRSQLAQWEWKRKSKRSLLGELEMLSSTVAGAASWCRGNARRPVPAGAVEQMMAFDVSELSNRLGAYPQLRRYVDALSKLRDLVIDFVENRQAALSR